MDWIASTVTGLVLLAVVFVFSMVALKEQPLGKALKVISLGLMVVWVGVRFMFAIAHQIPAGSVGVVYQFGSIVGQIPEGLQVTAPWQDIRKASIQVQRKKFETLNSFSSETQDVFVVATVNYSVSPDKIQGLYRDVGPNWSDVLVEPRVSNFFKEETVKYKTVDIAPQREAIRTAVRNRLAQELAPYSVTIHDLLIDDIDFRKEFKDAIEHKQIASQDALREHERVQQAKYEADQVIERAKGAAESVKVAADAQTYANSQINSSLTREMIEWQMVQKLAPNIQVMLLPAGQGMILDTKSLLGTPQSQPTQVPAPQAR